MLQRDLDRLTRDLTQGILATFREASVTELAELIPAVAALLREREPRSRESRDQAPARSAMPLMTGYLRRDVLAVLGASDEGLRSEEIQASTGATTRLLRIELAALVDEGLVDRAGQARGTRYTLADAPKSTERAPKSAPKAKPVREEPVVLRDVAPVHEAPVVPRVFHDVAPRASAPAQMPLIEAEPPSAAQISAVRVALGNSSLPMSAHEVATATGIDGETARFILDHIVQLGLAERAGSGRGRGYRLTSSAMKPSEAASDSPRVVRRAPRQKGWEPAPSEVVALPPEPQPTLPIDAPPEAE